MKISVICVYNRIDELNRFLLKSLEEAEGKVELILLNSQEHKFSSSAEGLNLGANLATGDIYFFSHQDVYIKNLEELYAFAKFIDSLPIGDVVGAAAAKEGKKANFTNYTSGSELNPAILDAYTKSERVSCVDESFFGMKSDTYKLHPFDEVLCDDWHLYAVETSLFARKNGCSVYFFPIQIHHCSEGKISLKYMKELVSLADYYKKDFKYIWTTCYKIKTNFVYTRILYWAWFFHRLILGKKM